MLEIFNYSFMVRAFLAGAMVAVIAPLIGNFLVIKRMSLIADTLAHAALAGVAIGLLLGLQPMFVTIILTVIAALLIEKLRSSQQLPPEAVLAMFLPGGLALSVVLISLANGLNSNLFSYLFGSITTVRSDELWLILGLGVVTLTSILYFRKPLLFTALDEESAKVSGVKVGFMNALLLVLTAITVSLSMRVVGVLLIGALMVIPVLTAMQLSRSFKETLLTSVLSALLAVVIGLFLAFYLNLPAGGAIVLVSLTLFGVTTLVRKFL